MESDEESNEDDQGHLRRETHNDTKAHGEEKAVSFISEQETSPTPACGPMKSNLSRVYLLLHARNTSTLVLWAQWAGSRGRGRCRLVLSRPPPLRPITPCPCELFDASRYRVQPPTSWVDAAIPYG